LDRYRKHFLMFEYWNGELIESLRQPPINPKRFRRASSEALAEMEQLKALLSEDAAARLAPHIETRKTIDAQLQSGSVLEAQASALWHELNAQTRQLHRQFYWREVEEMLNQTAGDHTTGAP